MRSVLVLVVYLALLVFGGAHRVRLAPVGHDLTVSLVANDTDSDDDMLGGPCLHCQPLDDGLQNFDRAVSPALPLPAEQDCLDRAALSARDRLDEGGLFRPPRTSLV